MTQDSESVVVPRDQQRQHDAEQLMDAAGTLSRCGYGEDAEEVRAVALRLAAKPSVREEPRNEVKRLISEHVSACFMMSAGGVIPTPLHPGPTADAIIAALAAAPSTSVREERLRYQAEFLVDRLSEFEGSLVEPSEAASEFYGHVAPAIARLEAALVPSTDEGKRHG